MRLSMQTFRRKAESIAQSKAVMVSIRILIVAIALLVAYLQTKEETTDLSEPIPVEKIENHMAPDELSIL